MRTFYSNLRPQRQLPHAQGGGVIGGSSSVTDSGTSSSSSSSSSRAGGSLEESHDDTSGSEGGPVRPAVVDGSSGHRSSRAFWDQAAFLLREVVGASCESGSADPLPPVWHVGPNERVSVPAACASHLQPLTLRTQTTWSCILPVPFAYCQCLVCAWIVSCVLNACSVACAVPCMLLTRQGIGEPRSMLAVVEAVAIFGTKQV